jgi:short-subunit dehydrogenase
MPNIVITGASKGIGKSLAEIFVKHGNHVCLCARSEVALTQTKNELLALNTNTEVHTFSCDVSKKDDVKQFADFVLQRFNTVDVLINNAGVFLGGQMHNEAEGTLEQMINTNLYSAYYLTRHLLPRMQQKKSGHIFNICSIASFVAYPHGGSYAISKFAMLGFSKSLREEMKPYGIKVCSVMPGATLTESWSGVDIPKERFMPSEDVAKMVFSVYSLSDRTDVEEIVLRPQLGDL